MGTTTTTSGYRQLIGGEWVDGSDGTYEIINPATEEVVAEAPEASADDVRGRRAGRRRRLPGLEPHRPPRARRPARGRRQAPRRAHPRAAPAGDRRGRRHLVGGLAHADPRRHQPLRPLRPGRHDRPHPRPAAAADRRHPARPRRAHGWRRQPRARRRRRLHLARTTSRPRTWSGKIAPALAVGCTVVMKPAPQDPLCVIELAKILDEVGFPPGVVNIVTGAKAEVGAVLVDDDNVDMVSFTGSTQVGIKIVEAGARTMKRQLQELGGKGACVVTADADLDKAVTGIASVWAFHSGQICTAPTRVHRAPQPLRRARRPPGRGGQGPQGRRPARGRHRGRPGDLRRPARPHRRPHPERRRRGRRAGRRRPRPGHGPGLLRGPHPARRLRQRHEPGARGDLRPGRRGRPVRRRGRGHPHRQRQRLRPAVLRLLRGQRPAPTSSPSSIRSGSVGINTVQRHHEVPFGGFKLSGIGRDGGDWGLEAYTELQSVVWPA